MNNKSFDEGILYSSYIKYDKLFELVNNSILSNSNSNNINIFIDLNSIVMPLYRYPSITFNDYSCLCSILVNMCAHYRNYFRIKHRVESEIFIVYSRNVPDSCKNFIQGYNCKTEATMKVRKDIEKFVEDNISIMTALCPFLPNIYMIRDDSTETASLIKAIYDRPNIQNIPNLIISKDPYSYTLAAIGEAVVFRPSKYNKEDTSFYIDKLSIWDAYRISICNKIDHKTNLSGDLFPFVLALSSASFRGLQSILNFNKALTLVEQGVKNGFILNAYIEDAEFAVSSLKPLYDGLGITELNPSFILSRYKAINAIIQSFIYKMTTNYYMLNSNIINLYDPESVKKISEVYFTNNPLDLNRL